MFLSDTVASISRFLEGKMGTFIRLIW